jgi:alkanesulfonate monooxygenase SsuD/methylene tetrahydromethanopterin reductase-like flavin-dependent oxidoreductase (luciferase family)
VNRQRGGGLFMEIDLFYELAVPAGGRAEAEVYRDTLAEIALADRLGFHGVWLVEHHFTPEYSHSSAPELVLAAASQQTRTLRLGHAVVLLPYHHPLHVAERAAALDVLSGGRLELGVGRGFAPSEYAAFGADMRDGRGYVEETLAILRQAAQGPLDHRGPRFRFAGIEVVPKPLQRPHPPLWTAAVSPATFRWAAQQGLGVLAGPFKPWALVRRDLAAYRRAWRQHHPEGLRPGHNPRFAMALGVLCLEDGGEARRWAADAFLWYYRRLLDLVRPALESTEESYAYYRRLGRLQGLVRRSLSLVLLERMGMVAVGDPDSCGERLARLERAGVDRVLCAVGAGAVPSEIVRRSLAVMAERVLPRFHR